MNPMPQHRALLGLDVIGSASNHGFHLDALRAGTEEMLHTALPQAGIPLEEVTYWEPTGDGAMLTLPSGYLGALLDASAGLEGLAAEHNRWRKPDIRLRIAVHVGPMGEEPGYYEPKITLSRLLNAPVFKQVVKRCLAERTDGSVNTALIVSDDAYRAAFGGDHVKLVNRADFATVSVRDKEFSQSAQIRVPHFEPASITEFAETEPAAPKSAPKPTARPTPPPTHIEFNGPMHGSQVGQNYGDITIGLGRQ